MIPYQESALPECEIASEDGRKTCYTLVTRSHTSPARQHLPSTTMEDDELQAIRAARMAELRGSGAGGAGSSSGGSIGPGGKSAVVPFAVRSRDGAGADLFNLTLTFLQASEHHKADPVEHPVKVRKTKQHNRKR